MSWIKKIALNFLGPMIVNEILKEITPAKIAKLVAMGRDELVEFVGEAFDKLSAMVERTDNKWDDAALSVARNTVLQLVALASTTNNLLGLLEDGAELLVVLAKKTDNELDDAVAQGVLDAIQKAQG
jgi:hypothetical protein